jgi:hypothetical protein
MANTGHGEEKEGPNYYRPFTSLALLDEEIPNHQWCDEKERDFRKVCRTYNRWQRCLLIATLIVIEDHDSGDRHEDDCERDPPKRKMAIPDILRRLSGFLHLQSP